MDGWHSRCRIDLQKIILNSTQKKVLKRHAEAKKPNESCAILFGIVKDNATFVKDIFLAENMEQSPASFTISNDQVLEGYKIAKEKKLNVVGIFHSHPSSQAAPSSIDRVFMETNPVVWIIFSGVSEEFRAYILDSEINEVPIEII